ncbi:MAG: HlyD family efflux transporter periplasmic adaptor subunit [Capnocytophaga sp.]|nr:HlyD family efflux transporter periplasmic adaptor subunit [Capnocytophaga sp.]
MKIQNGIYIAVLVLITGALVSLPLVSVPISASARGVIRSGYEDMQLTASVSGRVVYSSLLKNNQSITKGDTLLVITTELLDTQKELIETQLEEYQARLSDLAHLVQGRYGSPQTGQYRQEAFALRERLAQLQARLTLAQKELDRATQLYDKQVIARAEYEKIFYAHQELERELHSIRRQQTATWQAQHTETEQKLQSLKSELERIGKEQHNYVMTAPESGSLTGYKSIQQGSFIVQGQSVAVLSPERQLIAECAVSPKDIGFIRLGQKVRFQIDTYNYNQWGLLEGSVAEIDRNINADTQSGEGYFRILCDMDSDFLQLKNGYRSGIGKGMTLTARFHLLDRTLWQLLFDRVDDWFNPNLA